MESDDEDDAENEEWHEIHDEDIQDLRDGTTVPSIDNSDLPMFDSQG